MFQNRCQFYVESDLGNTTYWLCVLGQTTWLFLASISMCTGNIYFHIPGARLHTLHASPALSSQLLCDGVTSIIVLLLMRWGLQRG